MDSWRLARTKDEIEMGRKMVRMHELREKYGAWDFYGPWKAPEDHQRAYAEWCKIGANDGNDNQR